MLHTSLHVATRLLAVVCSFAAVLLVAQQPALTPEAAAETVTRFWLANPLAKVPATGKPLATTGTWAVQHVLPGSTTVAACQQPNACLRVIYRVPESATVCTWVVGPSTRPGDRPRVVALDESAAIYMFIKQWAPGDPSPRPISQPRPVFPPLAWTAHVDGDVAVTFVIESDGTVAVAGQPQGSDLLRGSVLDAMRKWQFAPATINTRAVAFRTTLHFNFTGSGFVAGGQSTHCQVGMICPTVMYPVSPGFTQE